MARAWGFFGKNVKAAEFSGAQITKGPVCQAQVRPQGANQKILSREVAWLGLSFEKIMV